MADENAGIPIGRIRADHTGSVSNIVTEQVRYGEGIPRDDELGLLGDISAGRRVIELGIADNAVALAQQGAKAIAVDPDPQRISDLRLAANDADVSVECHQGDLGDLGFAPSGTIDLVLSVHTLDLVDDLGRILRQVHRVLKPGAPFILVLDHPFATVGPDANGRVRRYGEDRRTIADLLAALDRSNFRVEVFHELGVGGESAVPTTLALKVRKQGS
jgi:SAM-dependent methyltransferase